jgi:hypothetical protein
VHFSISNQAKESESEPFPTAYVATATGASAVAVGAVILIYFKKYSHKTSMAS